MNTTLWSFALILAFVGAVVLIALFNMRRRAHVR
jgi:uncharacterized membrane protein YeaQ/YmgE (transglycosylase-associated protein family)